MRKSILKIYLLGTRVLDKIVKVNRNQEEQNT